MSKTTFLCLLAIAGFAFAQPSATITSPVSGSTAVLGSTVTFELTLNSIPAGGISGIAISTGRNQPIKVFTSADTDFSTTPVRLPVKIAGLVGEARFAVLVRALIGSTAENIRSNPITLQVEPQSVVPPLLLTDGISSVPLQLARFSFRGETQDVGVVDSSTPPKQLWESRLLSTSSENAQVAEIPADRPLRILAKGAGTTRVWIGSLPVAVEVSLSSRRGDFDNDGRINVNDINVLRRGIGASIFAGAPDDRDLNHDGLINDADETALRALCDHPNCSIQAPFSPVEPVLECVSTDAAGNTVAFFGYNNRNDDNRNIPVGPNNQFSPAPQNRGQTTKFLPGRRQQVFSVPFAGSLTWSVKGPDGTTSSVTATASSPACSF